MNEYPEPLFPQTSTTPQVAQPAPRSLIVYICGAVLLIVVSVASVLLWPSGTEDTGAGSALKASAIPGSTTSVDDATSTPSAPSPAQMEEAVRDMYLHLPANTEAAWAMLGSDYANRTGKTSYEDFWSTIQTVAVLSVTPRDASTVVARITYTTTSGQVDTEDRRFSVVFEQGRLRITDSERIGAAAQISERPGPIDVVPTTPRATEVPAPQRGDLGIGVAMSVPACDGTGIVVLHSATNPGTYEQEIAGQLASHPGAQYLRTDNSCSSLRQQTASGDPIYAVFRFGGPTQGEVCTAVRNAGADAYGKWLDATTDPSYIIPC